MGKATALAGILLDDHDRFAIVVLSGDAIGVSRTRFADLPGLDDVNALIRCGEWVVIQRSNAPSGDAADSPSSEGGEDDESARLAISVALYSWPNWGAHLHGVIKPQWPIPFVVGDPS